MITNTINRLTIDIFDRFLFAIKALLKVYEFNKIIDLDPTFNVVVAMCFLWYFLLCNIEIWSNSDILQQIDFNIESRSKANYLAKYATRPIWIINIALKFWKHHLSSIDSIERFQAYTYWLKYKWRSTSR